MSNSANNSFVVLVGQNSDRGRRREQNEDSCDVFTTMVRKDKKPDKLEAYLAVVADGIAGVEGGKEASRMAVETIKKATRAERALRCPLSKLLDNAIVLANTEITKRARTTIELREMSTTVVAAMIADKHLYVSHAGDSRAYLIRQDAIYQLTLDHTWVQEAITVQYLTPKEAAEHPNRNVVNRYLGIDETIEVDNEIVDISRPQNAKGQPRTVRSLELEVGDVVLLCSDGLTDLVTEQEILHVVKKHPSDPQQTANKLINAANAKGGTDNITAVVMALKSQKKAKPIIPLIITLLLVVLLMGGGIYSSVWGWPNFTASSFSWFSPASSPSPLETPLPPTAISTTLPMTPTVSTEGDNVELSLLLPERGKSIKASSIDFLVEVVGKQENDKLKLIMITEECLLTLVSKQTTDSANCLPNPDPTIAKQSSFLPVEWEELKPDLYEATLDKPPNGFGKEYYWIVLLIRADGTKVGAIHKLQWEEP